MEIWFSEEVATTSLTEDFVHHVSWILSKKEVLRSFESIFSTAHAGNHPHFGTPLSCIAPRLDTVSIMFRGLESGKEILVLEVLSIEGLDIDLQQIVYKHPSLKDRTFEPGHKKRRILRPNDEGFDIVDDIPKVDTNQPVVTHEPTMVGYTHKAEVVRISENFQVVHQGNSFIEREGKGGVMTPASVDESIVGGKTQPVDVQSLEVINGMPIGELQEFLDMIRRLKERRPELFIDTSIVDLPTGRQFAILPNGRRRKCAVVRIQRKERLTYILEVSRVDGHPLSTLLIYPSSINLRDIHNLISEILHDLVYNQGHWNLRKITTARTRTLRHTHSFIDEWVRRVVESLV